MSTKNLARTVIEGGRTGHSKYARRLRLRRLRRDTRLMCHALTSDPDAWASIELPRPHRWWYEISHADKIGPCDRFLQSRAGRPWDAVHSEICRRFDRRKLAGKHVTNDHLLAAVHFLYEPRWFGWRPPKFWVDDGGIFRYTPQQRWYRAPLLPIPDDGAAVSVRVVELAKFASPDEGSDVVTVNRLEFVHADGT